MINSYGDISPRTALYAAKKFLTVAQPLMVTQRFAQVDTQSRNSSDTRKWRRYESFVPNTAPLSEGVTRAGHAIEYTDVTAVLRQYGDRVNITDKIQDTHEDSLLSVCMERSGEQAAQSIELITIDVLKAGTNVIFGGNVASRADVDSAISRADLRLAVRTLDRNLARPITQIINPSPNYSTSGVEAAFYAMGHTDLEPDIRNIAGFKTVVEYGNPKQAVPGEVGAVERVRFILTQNWTPWEKAGASGTTYLSGGTIPAAADSADVYPLVIVGRDAYAVVNLQGSQAVKIMVLNPGVPRGGDEGGQRGSVYWKTYFAAAILNELWMIRLEVACTAVPA